MRQTANQAIVLHFVMAAIVTVTLTGEEPSQRSTQTSKAVLSEEQNLETTVGSARRVSDSSRLQSVRESN